MDLIFNIILSVSYILLGFGLVFFIFTFHKVYKAWKAVKRQDEISKLEEWWNEGGKHHGKYH